MSRPDALAHFVPGTRIEHKGKPGTVTSPPAVGALGHVCFSARLDDGAFALVLVEVSE